MNAHPATAKINLALVVGPPRDDGKHEVATVLQRIDLADRIEVEPRRRQLTSTASPDDTLVATRARRCSRGGRRRAALARADREAHPGRRRPRRRQLRRRDRARARERDAAASRCRRDRLHALAAPLGADVPFFLTDGPQLGDRRRHDLGRSTCRRTTGSSSSCRTAQRRSRPRTSTTRSTSGARASTSGARAARRARRVRRRRPRRAAAERPRVVAARRRAQRARSLPRRRQRRRPGRLRALPDERDAAPRAARSARPRPGLDHGTSVVRLSAMIDAAPHVEHDSSRERPVAAPHRVRIGAVDRRDRGHPRRRSRDISRCTIIVARPDRVAVYLIWGHGRMQLGHGAAGRRGSPRRRRRSRSSLSCSSHCHRPVRASCSPSASSRVASRSWSCSRSVADRGLSARGTTAVLSLGRSQVVRQRVLVPRSQVRILAPQPLLLA